MTTKRIIVLGGTSGIGRALAKLCVSEGHLVGVAGRRENLLAEIKSEQPDRYFTKQIDITDYETLPKKLDDLVSELGGCDIFIMASAVSALNPELDFSLQKSVLEINVIGFTAAVDWAYKLFAKQGYGHLVAITSMAALIEDGRVPTYNSTKSYQLNYIASLRNKAKRDNVKIDFTDIRPGFVETDMLNLDGLFWVCKPDKAARQIWQAIRYKFHVMYISHRFGILAFLIRLRGLFCLWY